MLSAAPQDADDLLGKKKKGVTSPYVEAKEKQMKVAQLIEKLGLQSCAETMVGSVLLRGISGGEKKRVSIGITSWDALRVKCRILPSLTVSIMSSLPHVMR